MTSTCLLKRAVQEMKAVWGVALRLRLKRMWHLPECWVLLSPIPPTLLCSVLPPPALSHSSPHPTFSPVAPVPLHISQGASKQGETVAWLPPPLYLLPYLLPAFTSWGKVGHKGRIFLPAPSSSLWPLFLSLPGLAEAKENRALPQPTLPLSLTSCSGGRWFTPSPPLAQDLALVSSFSRASRIRGPA